MEQRLKAINGILLGDSGYPIRDWLLTPFNAPEGEEEDNFNNCHVLTRNVIERCFGVIKKRFYALHNRLKTGPTHGMLSHLRVFCITQYCNVIEDTYNGR